MRMTLRMCLSVVLCAAMVSGVYADNYQSDTTIGDHTETSKTVVFQGVTVTVNGTWTGFTDVMQIGSNGTGLAKLVIADGGVADLGSVGINLGHNSPGMLEVSGGSFTASTGSIGSNRDAFISLNSGSLTFTSTATFGYGDGVNVDYTQTGGAFRIDAASLRLGFATSSNATMTISGGTFVVDKALTVGDADSNGTFRVEGGGASQILMGANEEVRMDTNFSLGGLGHSTLEFAIGAADATTGFNVTRIDAYGVDMRYGGTVDMSLLAGFTPTEGQTFDLLKDLDGSIDISQLTLADGDSESWMLQTNVNGDTLQAVAVPEPATMGLLGLGLVGLIARRRKH